MEKIVSMKKSFWNIILGLVCLLSLSSLQAQQNELVQFMRYNPVRVYTAPATTVTADAYLTFPFLGDLNVGLYNPTFRYGKMFETQEGYPVNFTPRTFVDHLSEKNPLALNLDMELLGFGFRVDSLFLSFDYRLKVNAATSFSKDLFGLLLLGNMEYVNQDRPADLSMSMDVTAYRELSVGAQYKLNSHWTVGARQKVLFGLVNATTRQFDAQLYTNPDDYSIAMQYQADIQLASALRYNLSTDTTLNLTPMLADTRFSDLYKNWGLGWDLGVQYTFDHRFSLSLSVLDLGFMKWNAHTARLTANVADAGVHYQDGAFLFDGLSESELESIFAGGEAARAFLDSLTSYFPMDITQGLSYVTPLPSRVMLQFDYNLTPQHRFSALVQAARVGGLFSPSLTVAYSASFTPWVDLCAAYTIKRNSYDNLGIGLGFNLKVVTLFFTCENIVPLFNPTRISNPNLQFGLVFNWNYKK